MRFLVGFVAGTVVGIAVTLGGLISLGHFLAVEDQLTKADAIVAISGDQGARTATAVDLWKRGFAPVIVFAGASEDPASLPSAELMKREAVRLGVPAARVLTESSSATTKENASRVVALLDAHSIRRAILVTSPYHQRRAALLFQRELAGTEVTFTNYPARDEQWDRSLWWASEPSRSLTLVELAKLGVEVMGGLLRKTS